MVDHKQWERTFCPEKFKYKKHSSFIYLIIITRTAQYFSFFLPFFVASEYNFNGQLQGEAQNRTKQIRSAQYSIAFEHSTRVLREWVCDDVFNMLAVAMILLMLFLLLPLVVIMFCCCCPHRESPENYIQFSHWNCVVLGMKKGKINERIFFYIFMSTKKIYKIKL